VEAESFETGAQCIMPFRLPTSKGGLLESLVAKALPTDESIERARRDKVPTPPGFGATGSLLKTLASLLTPSPEEQLFSLAGPLGVPATVLSKLGGIGTKAKPLMHGTMFKGFDTLIPDPGTTRAAFTTPIKDLAEDFGDRIMSFKGNPKANLFDYRNPKEVDRLIDQIKSNYVVRSVGRDNALRRRPFSRSDLDRLRKDIEQGYFADIEAFAGDIKDIGFDGYIVKETETALEPTSYAFFRPKKDLGKMLSEEFKGPVTDISLP